VSRFPVSLEPWSARPAVGPALAFLVGCACGGALGAPRAGVALALALLLLSRAAGRRRLAVGAALVAMLFLGGSCALEARRARDARLERAGLRRGAVREGEVAGKLLAAPAPADDGAVELRLRQEPLTLRLRVVDVPVECRGPILALRRGDRVRVWSRVWRPRRAGNPEAQDPERRLAASGVDAVGSVKSARLVRLERRGAAGPLRGLDDVRAGLRRRIELRFERDPDVAALYLALLVGERGNLPPPLAATLRDAGLSHLVAISGLHVGLTVLVLVAMLRRCGLRRALVPAGLPLLLSFAVLVGGRPSVWRAALAALGAVVGRAVGREGDARNTLALLGAALAATNPALVGDAAFLLTFAATAGIVVALERPRAGQRARGAPIRLSLAAYLATSPITAGAFGRVTPIALAGNLPGIPLCAVCLGLGYLTLLLDRVPLVGGATTWSAVAAARALLALARGLARFEAGAWRVAAPSDVLTACAYVAALGALHARPAPLGRLLGATAALLLALVHLGPPPAAPCRLQADLIDVGQGQALLLAGTAAGTAVLLDAGGAPSPRFDVGERVVVPHLLAAGRSRVAVLALSHEHLDHAGGAAAVLRQLEVEELWLAPGWPHSALLRDLVTLAVERGVAVVQVERGHDRTRGGIRLQVVGPAREQVGLSVNDRSLVIACGSPPHRLLVPGDVERTGEAFLSRLGAALAVEALVVAHHGGATGTTEAFLAATAPDLALISCGRGNRFGHPHPTVLERLRRAHIPVGRTDLQGCLRLVPVADGFALDPGCHGASDQYSATRSGTGMKDSASRSSSSAATQRRLRPSGSDSSSRGGWRSRIQSRMANHSR